MCGLFDKIFKKKEKEKIETSLELLPTIIQKNFEAKISELEMESAKRMSEIKYLHENIYTIINDIENKEMSEKKNARFDKAAETAKKQIVKQFKKTLDKIDPKPITNELNDVRAYANESYSLLINEVNSFRKVIAYTSVYLKDEMKELGNQIQEMVNKLNELRSLFEKNGSIFEFEKIKEKIKITKQHFEEIEKLEKQVQEITKEIEKRNEEIQKKEIEIKEMENSEELKKIKEIEEEISKANNEKQSLKLEVSSMLSTIDRPLQRFEGLIKSGRWKIDKEKEELLGDFMKNPLIALKRDINGKKFKEILEEILKAIEDEKIDLKEKEKEKRIDALQELINFDFFEKVFWKLNEIQKKQSELNKKMKENKSIQIINEKKEKKEKMKKEIEELRKEIEIEKNKIKEKNEKNEKNKAILEAFTEKTIGKQVKIAD
jgi:hypothetical protein